MKLYLEIRAGSGGNEADAFADELLLTYIKYAKRNDIQVKLISEDKTKVLRLEGKHSVLSILLNEIGTHRVQRFSKGKLHTSVATVAVLKENLVSMVNKLPEHEFQVSTFKSSGAGGQHVNKTESAVRIKHIPTGIVVACQSERSQHINKALAYELLYLKINQQQQKKEINNVNKNRNNQIGKGMRSESKRTYNFIRNEVIDHETNKRISIKEFFQKCNLTSLT